jgi:hypothetical protein
MSKSKSGADSVKEDRDALTKEKQQWEAEKAALAGVQHFE